MGRLVAFLLVFSSLVFADAKLLGSTPLGPTTIYKYCIDGYVFVSNTAFSALTQVFIDIGVYNHVPQPATCR